LSDSCQLRGYRPKHAIVYIIHIVVFCCAIAGRHVHETSPLAINRTHAAADTTIMLNRLPKDTGTLTEILADIGNPKTVKIAKALGVSRRTVERWKAGKTPRVALLSLWWLSREGHSTWDAEMHNRTMLALGLHDSLWRELRKLRKQLQTDEPRTADIRAFSPPVHEPSTEPGSLVLMESRRA